LGALQKAMIRMAAVPGETPEDLPHFPAHAFRNILWPTVIVLLLHLISLMDLMFRGNQSNQVHQVRHKTLLSLSVISVPSVVKNQNRGNSSETPTLTPRCIFERITGTSKGRRR